MPAELGAELRAAVPWWAVVAAVAVSREAIAVETERPAATAPIAAVVRVVRRIVRVRARHRARVMGTSSEEGRAGRASAEIGPAVEDSMSREPPSSVVHDARESRGSGVRAAGTLPEGRWPCLV